MIPRRWWWYCGAVGVAAMMSGCAEPRETPRTDAAAESSRVDSTRIESAAHDLVAFLQGSRPLPDSLVSDSVVLIVAPEGGDERKTLARAALRDRTNWVAGSYGIEFAPGPTLTKLTTRPGVHLRCSFAHPLASVAPEFSGFPHVGTMLEAADADSCLQSWNSTFVFDTATSHRLVAVVYDRFEW